MIETISMIKRSKIFITTCKLMISASVMSHLSTDVPLGL